VWIVISWPACQDDAFIHLRYADHLLHQHFVTYDGVHRTFGASSLLYIAVLAVLRAFTSSPELPRAVSTVCHALLFCGIAWGLGRRLRGASRGALWSSLLLLACLVTPSAVRWLDDGMETSFVLFFIAVWVFFLESLLRAPRVSALQRAGLVVLAFFSVLLRLELLLLVAVAALVLLYVRRRERHDNTAAALLSAAAPVLGAVLAAAFIVAIMHSLLPDTAIAKAHDVNGWRGTLEGTLRVFESSPGLGCGTLLLEALTLLNLAAVQRRFNWPALLANSLFPAMAIAALARAQQVQGIRYFIWAMVFAALWNILALVDTPGEPARERALPWIHRSQVVFAVLLVAIFAVETPIFAQAFAKRRGILAEFRRQHLDQLHDLTLGASDIGYIGYFTGSPVCDEEGLVNGREAAALITWERGSRCAQQGPRMGFFAEYQMAALLGKIPDRRQWSICAVYDLGNLKRSELHYLVAAPEVTPRVCAAAGNKPVPIQTVWPDVGDDFGK
jgi:hypothetical protein